MPSTKSTTEQEFFALEQDRKTAPVFVTAAYAQFQTNLEQAKATKFPCPSPRHQFHAGAGRQLATQISQGVETGGTARGRRGRICAARSDDNVRYAPRTVASFRGAHLFEPNAGCMSYGCSDVGWAYSRMFLPWGGSLSFLRGIEQSLEPLTLRTLFAAYVGGGPSD